MSNAKQVKAVTPLIDGLPSTDGYDSGDGVSLFNTSHTTEVEQRLKILCLRKQT